MRRVSRRQRNAPDRVDQQQRTDGYREGSRNEVARVFHVWIFGLLVGLNRVLRQERESP
jgi:hypothetical protein